LQDAFFVQGVLNLFQLHHLEAGREEGHEKSLTFHTGTRTRANWVGGGQRLLVPTWHTGQSKGCMCHQAPWPRGVRAWMGEAWGLWMPR
jgi:hypothetical protein